MPAICSPDSFANDRSQSSGKRISLLYGISDSGGREKSSSTVTTKPDRIRSGRRSGSAKGNSMSGDTRAFDRRTLLMGGTIALASGTMLFRTGSAFAQDATPEDGGEGAEGGMPPIPEGAVVVAEGLWNPGDIAFAEDGTLYIAEGGVYPEEGDGGGPTEGTPDPSAAPPMGPEPIVPPQVSVLAADGTQSVLTTTAGGVGIGVSGGSAFVARGGGSVGSGLTPQPAENTVSRIDVATGESTVLAEIGPYEVENNPDGTDVNPNLYGMAISTDGMIYQADAGGNTIYRIDSATGEFDLFAVVPNLTDLTGSTPTAEEQAQQPGPRQSVPTSVAITPDGNIDVVLLSEVWEGPSVITYAPDGTWTAGVSGLSMIVNATYGPDGLLYVSQLTADFSGEMPAPGAVMRVNPDDSIETVVDGLFFPHGIAFDSDGNLYVATNSIISGPDAPLGQVLRIDGVATPAA